MMNNEIRPYQLIQKWQELSIGKGVYLVSEGTINWMLRLNEEGNPEAGVITQKLFSLNSNVEKISVEVRELDSKTYYVALGLNNHDFINVFAAMVADLINSYSCTDSFVSAIKKIKNRYKSWEQLFKRDNPRLPEIEIKGLIGELLELKRILISAGFNSYRESIQGWSGPLKMEQDFIYPNYWLEIKTVSISSEVVKISSLGQLTRIGIGKLIVYKLKKSISTDDTSFSIVDLITEIKTIILGDPDSEDLFEERLEEFGILDYQNYDNLRFRLCERLVFNVDSSFPRLTAENVPDEVASCQYDLRLAALEKWMVYQDV